MRWLAGGSDLGRGGRELAVRLHGFLHVWVRVFNFDRT